MHRPTGGLTIGRVANPGQCLHRGHLPECEATVTVGDKSRTVGSLKKPRFWKPP
jgi:hypothetical protein